MKKPLCVDCDGTLLRTDLLHESLVRVLLRKPWMIFPCALWLFRGRAYMKERLAEIAGIDVAALPFREEVINYIKAKRTEGGCVLLVTAAAKPLATAVAEHCGLFDEVLASDSGTNLKGHVKKNALVNRFGVSGFHYVGDSSSDLAVWESCDEAILVGKGGSLRSRVSAVNSNIKEVGLEQSNLRTWFKLIRIHQWAKNLIIFIPLITAHKIFDVPSLFSSVAAFFAFSLLASATYILNDLYDLEHDRVHRTKRGRPLASGVISLPAGVLLALILGLIAVLIGLAVSPLFLAVLGVYFVSTLLYSVSFKRAPMVDVIMLAGLYTWRLVAGSVATGIVLSAWLLAFAMFFFASLAMAKRFVELSDSDLGTIGDAIKGRGYRASDKSLIGILGGASAVVSVLVIILYVNSPDVRILYAHPYLLLLLAPLFFYWLGRVWLLASRGDLHEDPVLFAVKDKVSYFVALWMVAVIVVAAFRG